MTLPPDRPDRQRTRDPLGSEVRRALGKLAKCKYCYLADTDLNGVGVFAARDFRFGDVVVEDLDGDYYIDALPFDELERQGIPIDYVMQVGEDAFRVPTGTIEDFTNHSCDPNTGLRMDPRGPIAIAIRDIRTHDEITFDYSTWLSGNHLNMQCRCGAQNCRGLISSFHTLPRVLRQRYLALGVVADFALRTDRDLG